MAGTQKIKNIRKSVQMVLQDYVSIRKKEFNDGLLKELQWGTSI
jgi:hypothetical protein